MNNWHWRVSLKYAVVKNYSWSVAACIAPECTVWPTVIIIKACESKACHSETMGQRGQCSISRDLGTLCEAEVIWDKDDDNTNLETFACSKFYWLVTEFSNLSGVLCKILAFSLHPTFVLAQNYYPVSLLVITAGRLNDRITKWIRLEGTSGRTRLFRQVHLEPVAQERVQMAFKYLQEWRFHNLYRQPLPSAWSPYSKIKGLIFW